jgi:hypothetical protein
MIKPTFPRALVTALAVCGAFAPAAVAGDPAPGLEAFAGCPEPPAAIDHCTISTTTGRLELGRIDLRLDEPITLNGGVPAGSPAPFEFDERGGLFSPRVPITDPRLPGGPVQAKLQLAGTIMVALPASETMPLKVKLEHPLLGADCYIGSEREPLTLNLTTGTTAPPPPNQPISGAVPGFSLDPADPRIFLVSDGVFVDNAFRTPAASGCGPHGALDRVVNALAGLPSPAGRNTAVLAFDGRTTTQDVVYPAGG